MNTLYVACKLSTVLAILVLAGCAANGTIGAEKLLTGESWRFTSSDLPPSRTDRKDFVRSLTEDTETLYVNMENSTTVTVVDRKVVSGQAHELLRIGQDDVFGVKLENCIVSCLKAAGFNVVDEQGEANLRVSYKESIPIIGGVQQYRLILSFQAVLERTKHAELLIVRFDDVKIRDSSQGIEVVEHVLRDALSLDDGTNTFESFDNRKVSPVQASFSSRSTENLIPCIRSIELKGLMLRPGQDVSLDDVDIANCIVWINTKECRTAVAKWASSLGGDEKKIESSLWQLHSVLSVESIILRKFFKRDEVPGLFENRRPSQSNVKRRDK